MRDDPASVCTILEVSTHTPNRTGFNYRTGVLLFGVLVLIVVGVRTQLAGQQPAQSGGGAIIGVIQDDRGAPVANAKVTLTSGDILSAISTQADGKFEFHNLKPAQYRITVEAARFRKEAVNITLRPDETFATPPVKLTPSSLHV